MENQESSFASQETTEARSREKASRPPRSKKVIEGVTYIRDAFGCYVPESVSLLSRGIRIRTPKDALPALAEIRNSPQEIFMVLDLDGNHQIIEARKVTVGLANQSQIHPRETFRSAIQSNAASILVAHNHPSGNLEPSESDLAATRRLVEVSKIIGIPILDHVIVSSEGFVSLRERFPAYFS
jgi:DNA repair protein RadC